MVIYEILQVGTALVVLFYLYIIVYFAKSRIKNIIQNRKPYSHLAHSEYVIQASTMKERIVAVIACIIVATLAFLADPAGLDMIDYHNIDIKPEGTYSYYVELKKHNAEKIVVPAEITIDEDDNQRFYRIQKAYLPNNKILKFNTDEQYYSLDLKSFNTVHLIYDEKLEWYDMEYSCKLLNEHTTHKQIIESKPSPTFLIIKEIITVGATVIILSFRTTEERHNRRNRARRLPPRSQIPRQHKKPPVKTKSTPI